MSRPAITNAPGCNCAGEAWPGAEPHHAVDCASHNVDPDFASLLEREPQETLDDGTMTVDDALKLRDLARQATDSAHARIKELEGVLVAIRGKTIRASRTFTEITPEKACEEIRSLINETLDPCKPWCVLEPGHGGACASDVEFCGDRDE